MQIQQVRQVFLKSREVMRGSITTRKRSRSTNATTTIENQSIFNWTDFPKLVQWEILRWVITITRDPQLLQQLCLVSKLWNQLLNDWLLWFPIFETIRNERESIVPPGIEYLVRPNSLRHLNPINLFATKILADGEWPSGLGTVIRHRRSLFEGSLWGGRFHQSGVLYEHASEHSPAFRYQGRFKEHHLSCTDGHCEYLMGDGTVFNGCIEYRDRQHYCNGLFRYSDTHPRFAGNVNLMGFLFRLAKYDLKIRRVLSWGHTRE